MSQILLQYLQGTELLLLVLADGLRRDHLLRHAGRDQHVVLLGDLYAGLLGVDLADAEAVAGLFEIELLGFVLGELDDVQPGDVGSLLAVRLEDLGRAIEEAFEAFDEDGSQGARAQVSGDALVAVEDAIVVGDEAENGWKCVVGGDEGQVVLELAGQVVDLKVVGVGHGSL